VIAINRTPRGVLVDVRYAVAFGGRVVSFLSPCCCHWCRCTCRWWPDWTWPR